MDELRRKRQRVRLMQKYLVNPPVKLLTTLGWLPGHAILETTGRRSAITRRVVVGVWADDLGRYWIVAEQGAHAGYVRNIAADPRVRLRLRGKWIDAHAEAVPSDDVEQRLSRYPRAHVQAVRRFGTSLLSVMVTPA